MKKRNHKIRYAFIAAALISQTASAIELKLATTPWPPFTGGPGEPRIVVQLVEEALKRLRIDDTVTVVQEGTLTSQLREKRFDGSPGIWRDNDRESFLEFSDPLLENRIVLVGKKGSNVNVAKVSDLKGKRVGIVTGFSYGDEIAQAKNVTFVKGPGHEENLEKLLRGEVDFLLVEDLLMQNLLAEKDDQTAAKIVMGTTPLVLRSLHFVLRKDVPNAAKIIKNFNAKLKAMLSDGTYNRILNLSWILADVDGDGKTELVSRSNRIGTAPPTQNYTIFYSKEEETASPRYMVNGQVYSDWDRVPPQYKVDELSRREKSDPLFKMKF